jgi:ribonucleoside-diphosphate reductase alpha subunit
MSKSIYSKYFAELKELWVRYEILEEDWEIILNSIEQGLPEKELTQTEFYDYLAKILATFTARDVIFSKIAGIYQTKIYDLEIGKNYFELITKQYECELISKSFYSFVQDNLDYLTNIICWERDKLIDYFGLKTLERSYLLKNSHNQFIERPQMVWLRTGIQIHGLWEHSNTNPNTNPNPNTKTKLELIKETYDYMSELYFTHATPTLFNSGSNYPQMSSCFLLQCPDDLEQIGDSFKAIMMISKRAGGIGINLSDIRSNNSLIKSNGGRSNGIIPLCKVLESLARYVNQSSKRLGSIACFIEVFHADIEDFIQLRKNTGDDNLRARDLFLGLWVCDAFMRAIETDADWYLMNPSESIGLTDCWGIEFETLYARYVLEGKYVKKLKARELYKKITECQFETGMPYMMFKDTINARSNQQNLGTIKNSNLCSEIVEYSSPDEIAVCNLASVSLPKFVSTKSDKSKYFDFEKFGKIVQICVHNLNNVIDLNYYPVVQTSKSNLAHRPIGIGVQGLADCYFAMGYAFDSVEATKLNKQIFECMYWNGLTKSNNLAKLYGKYSTFDGSPFSKGLLQFHLAGYTTEQIADKELGLDWINLIESIKQFGTRNSLLTTVMPTATTAQILNNNESIEPYTSNIYVRKVLAGEYQIINKHLIADLKKNNLWSNEIMKELLYDNGSVQKLSISQEIKNKYKTAYELKQSVIVKQAIDRGLFIDQSQSMNLFMEMPDHNKLASAHIYAWKNGLKTGSYYIRSQPITEAIKFSIDIDQINSIKQKRNNSNSQNDTICESCSA